MIFIISPNPSFPKRGISSPFSKVAEGELYLPFCKGGLGGFEDNFIPPLAKGGEGGFEKNKAGFTLIELLIAIALMALVVGALDQVAARVLSNYSAVQESQDLVPQARYALERMVTFVQESDYILTPPTTDPTEILKVSERLSDQYTNAPLPALPSYTAAGDGLPDADTNANGLVGEDSGDPAEFITFDLDKTDATNWKLMEQMPDYSTSSTSDFKARTTLCEHVTEFSCRLSLVSKGIVAITLKLQQGSKAVALQTTAKARWMD